MYHPIIYLQEQINRNIGQDYNSTLLNKIRTQNFQMTYEAKRSFETEPLRSHIIYLPCCLFIAHDKVNLGLCLTNAPLRHEGVCGNGCLSPRLPDLSTAWS
jgi:hypothetical protein